MTIAELLPQLQELPDTEKQKLIEILSEELARKGLQTASIPTEPLPIWSPYDSYEAASQLLDFAREQKGLS